MDQEKGSMTVSDAGRKGGEKVARERGHAFYSAIGQKGGAARRDAMAAQGQSYHDLGQKGGAAMARSIAAGEKPADFYSQIGKVGGNRRKADGADYAALGHKGGSARRDQGTNYHELGKKGGEAKRGAGEE